MQRAWDGLRAVVRDSVRHLLALLIGASTMAGTLWTFSAGRLSLPGVLELVFSVAGIVAALEIGVILGAHHLAQIERAALVARSRRDADALRREARDVMRWYMLVLTVSAGANLFFRAHTLNNIVLAGFMSLAAPALIWFLEVKVRPLPPDYRAIGRIGTQQALIGLMKQSESALKRFVRRIGQGKELQPHELHQMGIVLTLFGMFAAREEHAALSDAIHRATGGASTVDADAEHYLTSADIEGLYGLPRRTAQLRIAQMQGKRRGRNGRTWEAPASAVYAQLGAPGRHLGALPAPARRRSAAQRGADIWQQDIAAAQRFREQAQAAAPEPQEVA